MTSIFESSYYKIVEGPTWTEAETNSVNLGGHLVTINDADEQAFLEAQIPNQNLWIGLTGSVEEGN